MISLDVKALKEKRGRQEHYDLNVYLPELDGDGDRISFAGPADIDIDLTNTGFCILLTGKIEVPVEMDCARCLTPFKCHVTTDIFETYYDKKKGPPKTSDNDEEYIPFTGDDINIEPEVIKAVLLAIPIRALCDPECKGLCPQCGSNLNIETCTCRQENIDPRMAKLKELLEQ